MKLVVVAGARPNFMKIAPIMWEARRRSDLHAILVHTGQHYDEKMSKLFFEQLAIPKPDVDLEVGSGSHAVQTAEVMKRFEPVLLTDRPDAVVVVGDVNSTIACALTSVKLGIPVAHVEAGLRSFDWDMPEEINRILTDSISRWLFVSEESGRANLQKEGVAASRIHFVGNVMIDTLIASKARIANTPVNHIISEPQFAVITLHRPSNVDNPETLQRIVAALEQVQSRLPIVFPVHPRTRRMLDNLEVNLPRVKLVEPLGYLEFMALVGRARLVMTDSGGIQEETTYLGVPCITLRDNTERPSTVEQGTNLLVGPHPERILGAVSDVLTSKQRTHRVPELWDGKAARRILDILTSHN
jgi:UDP-N-acetylglucosamine 2-epimerase (non-hydrolysing)